MCGSCRRACWSAWNFGLSIRRKATARATRHPSAGCQGRRVHPLATGAPKSKNRPWRSSAERATTVAATPPSETGQEGTSGRADPSKPHASKAHVLRPLVNLEEAAAMLGIRTWHPDDDAGLEVLAALLARRTAIAAAPRPGRPQDERRPRTSRSDMSLGAASVVRGLGQRVA